MANRQQIVILLLTLILSFGLHAQDQEEFCQIQLIDTQPTTLATPLIKDSTTNLMLSAGKNRLRLTCSLQEQGVFSFAKNEIIDVSLDAKQINVTALAANRPAYLLPTGYFSIDFVFLNHHQYTQQFAWNSLASYFNNSLLNNIIMGLFYGLCLTLILYVFFMGQIVGDNRFRFYSLYVFCAATFFLLQEGQLNIFLPQHSFLLSHHCYLLFAGLTVFTATIFIVRLTDINISWPKSSHFGLELSAFCILLMSISLLFIDHSELSGLVGKIMARTTLALMMVIFIMVAIQAYRNVQSARIVLLSLGLMVVAVVFRTVLSDFSPFLRRYALIIAFAIEAFMLAMAVSAKIKNMKQDKLLAESQANTDVLCNVLNRRGWDAKAETLLKEQQNKGGVIGLLYIDLDEFKQINDLWGHDVGDKVLKVIAEIIRYQVRSSDSIGRIGGDEFVVLGHFQRHDEAENIASRVQARLSAFHLQIDSETSIEVSASVGYVIFDQVPDGIEDMLIKADEAMYQTKRGNKPQRVLDFET